MKIVATLVLSIFVISCTIFAVNPYEPLGGAGWGGWTNLNEI